MTTKKETRMMHLTVLASLAIVLAMATVARPARAVEANGGVTATTPAAIAIEKAARDNKYLFIFFYATKDANTDAAYGVLRTTMAKLTDRADSTAIYVADPAEKPIVDKFGVRGAPMPLVLAIAPTGAPTRAFPKTFDEAQLQQAFVSPARPSA